MRVVPCQMKTCMTGTNLTPPHAMSVTPNYTTRCKPVAEKQKTLTMVAVKHSDFDDVMISTGGEPRVVALTTILVKEM